MRTLLLCGAIGCLATCGRREPKPPAEPAVDLPRRATAEGAEPAAPDSITITLTADGRILARGRAWSLGGMQALLRGVVRHDGGSYYSSTVARLRIDRAAPWIHVRWLVHIAMMASIRELRFVYSHPELGEVDVRSSVSSLIGEPIEPSYVDVVRLRVVVDATGRVLCGERAAGSPSSVDTWVAEAAARVREGKLAGIRAEIVPRDGTPWGTVAAICERLRSGGSTPVRFEGGELAPGDRILALERLPPDGKAADRASDGSSDAGGMRVESVFPFADAEFDSHGDTWNQPEPEVPIEEPMPRAPHDSDTGK